MATLRYNGKQYELAKNTLAIVSLEDAMHTKSASLEEAYRKQFDYVCAVLKEEDRSTIFGTKEFEEMDLNELTLICNMISDAYMEKINAQRKEASEKLANNKAVDKIISAGNSVDKLLRAVESQKN